MRFNTRSSKDRSGATLDEVKTSALRDLARRDFAIEELRQRLQIRGFKSELIEQALDRFTELGYLNDERALSTLLRAMVREGYGKTRILRKLRERCFDEDLVEEHICPFDEVSLWVERATIQLEKKMRCPPEEIDPSDRDRAFRHLQQRGYSADVAKQVTTRIPRPTSFAPPQRKKSRRPCESELAPLLRKGWGPFQLRQKLRGKGFSDTEIDEAIAPHDDPSLWSETAKEVVEKKFRCEIASLDQKTRQKAYQHLRYRGFSSDAIRLALQS